MFATGSTRAPTLSTLWPLRRALYARYRLSRHIRRCLTIQQQRGFRATDRHGQEQDEETVLDEQRVTLKRSRFPREKYPLGRIVGKAGRRQREGTARLGTDALSKPFEVVVLRDVPQAKEQRLRANVEMVQKPDGSDVASAARVIESFISEENREPSQDEIDESIDSLRPDLTSLDDEQHGLLVEKLVGSYTTRQLSHYFAKALKLASVDADSVHMTPAEIGKREVTLRKSIWRPGRTPIEKRHNIGITVKKSSARTGRRKIAKQIIQLAWNLTIQSEEMQMGELEISLERWQVAFLFDLDVEQRPLFEQFIKSSLLLRESEVRPYWPDKIMRITARRRDAEEVARRLESKLREVHCLEVRLQVFETLLGSDGRPARFEELFQDADLKDVGERTTTVVDRKSANIIAIYGQQYPATQHARRLLLSMLALPSPKSVTVFRDRASLSKAQSKSQIYLPDTYKSGLSFLYRRLELARLSSISRKSQISSGAAHSTDAGQDHLGLGTRSRGIGYENSRQLLRNLTAHLNKVDSSHSDESRMGSDSSYWPTVPGVESCFWEVGFCKILQPASTQPSEIGVPQATTQTRKGKTSKALGSLKVSHASIMQPQIPGLHSLLSYFTRVPVEEIASDTGKTDHPKMAHPAEVVTPPFLYARFIPSPFTPRGIQAHAKLPHINIEFTWSSLDSASTESEDCSRSLTPTSMTAFLEEHQIHVPLPDRSCDLCFTRKRLLRAQKHRFQADDEIQHFTRELQESISRGTGALYSSPVIKFKLPAWILAAQASKVERDIEVEYLFERFEQAQMVEFVPARPKPLDAQDLDADVRVDLKSWRKSLSLRYMEVEGGVVGGRWDGLTLRNLWNVARRSITQDGTLSDDQTSTGNEIGDEQEDLSIDSDLNSDAQSADNGSNTSVGQLVDTALDLVNLLTRINSRELNAKHGD